MTRSHHRDGSRSPGWYFEDVAGGNSESVIRRTQGRYWAVKEVTNDVLSTTIEEASIRNRRASRDDRPATEVE